MNHGVLFDNGIIRKHSFDDWGLILEPFDVPFPKVKTDYVSIEGGHGSLDLTDAYGKIFYEDNSFNISFVCKDTVKYDLLLNDISCFLHGKKLKVFMYFDEEYYYDARCELNKYACNKSLGQIVVSVTAKPFKLKKVETITAVDVVGTKIVAFKNNRMETVPRFKATSNMTFKFNNSSFVLDINEVIYPQVEFIEGDNIIEFSGTGTVTVTYQEGKF